MKKALLVTASFFLFCGKTWAFQGEGTQPTFPVKLWIASVTRTADTNVLLASGPVVLSEIIITSATLNQGGASFVQFYGSTSPTFGSWVTSETPKIATDISVINGDTRNEFNIYVSSYLFYDKKGNAEIAIKYDWFNSSKTHPRRIVNGLPK